MVKRQRALLLGAAGLAVAGLVYWASGDGNAPPAAREAAGRGGRPSPRGGELPQIGLDRVQKDPARSPVGRRDIFAFGQPPIVEETPPPLPTIELPPTPVPAPTPTPLPALPVRYIGSLETKRGLKVAFFMTDKREVVSGQVGETVMNRFRVVRIGFESVDVQQAGSDQVQRLPLRSN